MNMAFPQQSGGELRVSWVAPGSPFADPSLLPASYPPSFTQKSQATIVSRDPRKNKLRIEGVNLLGMYTIQNKAHRFRTNLANLGWE